MSKIHIQTSNAFKYYQINIHKLIVVYKLY